ncbi:MAG: phosphoenolpyruvate---glycerone phosphotransferase subunit DhaL [Verrucomicrobiota bacterium]|nr:phosphoenolpyruvate---glycerone phosphotransferase subunit DhaL [Verrucomicrobiota bacterium]
MEQLVKSDILKIFSLLHKMAVSYKDKFVELDSVMGDGDLGLTMSAIFTAADEFVTEYSDDDIGTMIMKAGMVMAKAAPSTMGTLMATGFMRGGKALKGMVEIDLPSLSNFWSAFVDGIMDRGKSQPGEKTIIDALYPAAKALEHAVDEGASMAAAVLDMESAAEQGMTATKDMVAQHGRAAYYQEKSRTLQDPGATVGYMIVKVFADYIKGKQEA